MSNLSYLSDYQQFSDKHELNHHVKCHIDATYDELNATDRQVFKFIARYAVKYSGASHLKLETIANFIERTPRTTRNILAKLEQLNMIERIKRNRPKTGGRGANIITIKPYISEGTSVRTSEGMDADKPTDTTEEAGNSEKEPLRKLEKPNTYILATEYNAGDDRKPRALRQAIPQVIYDGLSPFFDADSLYKTYGILLRAKANCNITVEEYGQEYVDVYLNVVRSRKMGKIKRNFDGLLYTAWSRLSHEISRRMHAKNSISMQLFAEMIGD